MSEPDTNYMGSELPGIPWKEGDKIFQTIPIVDFNPKIASHGHAIDKYAMRDVVSVREYYKGEHMPRRPLTTCSLCGKTIEARLSADASKLEYLTPVGKWDAETVEVRTCPAADLISAGKLVAEIDVPTGNLVFTNFFRGMPAIERKVDKYSLNQVVGRNKIMQVYAEHNIGFGQTGNTILEVIQRRVGLTIQVPPFDSGPGIRGCVYSMKRPKRKILGEICCDMWRWMCMDESFITQHEAVPSDGHFTVKIQPGRYRIQH